MQILHTLIPGCLELQPRVLKDERGHFVKTFHEGVFAEHGLVAHYAEEYYTFSRQNVLRGLHFQVPPMDHVKVVTCITGTVLDAVVDLRVGSPAYGMHLTVELSSEKANLLYLPPGVAHGFFVMSSSAVLYYKVTTTHSPAHDGGVLWSSAGIAWPSTSPLISQRDAGFPALSDFQSPFVFSVT